MKNDLVIIGGGITGLATAYIASKSNLKVCVVEANKNFGGLLSTLEVGNSKIEHYYHHFFTHDKEIHWLINELGLNDELIYKKTSMGVFRNGKIFSFNNVFDLLKFNPISFFGKIRFGLTSLFLGKIANWDKYESTSTIDWLNRFAGEKATEAIFGPLLRIKFGPFYNKVPLSWMIGRLRQRMSSRKKGDEMLGYLNGSLDVLLQKLLIKLKENGVTLFSDSKVEDLFIKRNKIKGVITKSGLIEGSQIIFTIPSVYLSELIKPYDFNFYQKINNVKYFGAICVILEIKEKLSDIYWLNISDKGFPFGGVIEHTNFISNKHYSGKNIVYLSRYFAWEEGISKMSNNEISKNMIEKLKEVYPLFNEDLIIKAHVFKTKTAATVCDINFSKKIIDCKTPIKNLFIANMMHIYPDERSVNNSIRLAAEACNCMNINSKFVPKGSSLSGKIGFNSSKS